MIRMQTTLMLAVSICLGFETAAVAGGKGGNGGSGGGNKSGGQAASSFKPSNSMKISSGVSNAARMSTMSSSSNANLSSIGKLQKTQISGVTNNLGGSVKKTTIGDVTKVKSGINSSNRTASNSVKLDKATVSKLDLGKSGKASDKSLPFNKKLNDKISGAFDKGKDGPKDNPKDNGGKNDKHCDHHNNWCDWGFPFLYAYPFPPSYGYCGTVYYNDTYVQPVTSVVTIAAAAPVARGIDLELMEVRQIDMGDATNGPAYRVTIRNNSSRDVAQEFDVAVLASIGRQVSEDAVHAAARVKALRAGQSAVIEVRLPIDAMLMAKNATGQTVPFAFLTAVVDGRREVQDTNLDNNVQMLNRAEIAMAN